MFFIGVLVKPLYEAFGKLSYVELWVCVWLGIQIPLVSSSFPRHDMLMPDSHSINS